ncbi:MAG: dephospho-CoA kinase, partial [Planctomycetota bacterium]
MFAGRPIIGLAGGIGSGKSHIAKLLEQLGCCRVDSDEMVRTAYTHPQVKQAVMQRFGEDVITPDGNVNRKAIAQIVFRDASQRKWLEQLLHPVANMARVELMDAAARDPKVRAYVWDSPLLLETELDKLCDHVWFVDTPREDRIQRVESRGWDEAELDRRENAQWPIEKKRAAADFVILNGENAPASAKVLARLLNNVAPLEPSVECCGGANEGGCGCGTPGS